MALECPYCAQPNADHALVCNSCARDIAIPASLLAERDGLIRKREAVREELSRAKAELESYKIRKGRIAVASG